MKLDPANRSFLAIVAVGLLAMSFALWGALGGVLVPLVIARAAHDTASGAALGGAPALVASVSFLALLLGGLWRACRVLVRQLRSSRRLARRVNDTAAPSAGELPLVAAQMGLAGRVVLLEEPAAVSFVFGLLSPRVAVSRGLLQRASGEQLRAVLAHERYHVHNLDPLKGVLARTLAAALFLLPVLDCWRARYLAARELAADRDAIASCGRRPLAGALLQVFTAADQDQDEMHVAATFGAAELIEARVAQLEGPATRPRASGALLVRVAIRSLAGTALLGGAFLAAVLGFGGPEAVSATTGGGLANATLLGGISCGAPPIGAAGLAYLLLALRARRPVGSLRPMGRSSRDNPPLQRLS